VEPGPRKVLAIPEEVAYLGHTIIAVPESPLTMYGKIKAVRSWPRPSNVMDLRSFVGLCLYYCRFVPQFADIA